MMTSLQHCHLSNKPTNITSNLKTELILLVLTVYREGNHKKWTDAVNDVDIGYRYIQWVRTPPPSYIIF